MREVIAREFGGPRRVSAEELRRQSLLVSGMPEKQEALDFVTAVFDDRGWR
ncbi:MAG: antitoxin MazE-like protein [Vicinamibacterales bacterium]